MNEQTAQIATPNQATVETWGAQRKAQDKYLVMVEDIWGGTRTMRDAGMRHLPMEPGESAGQYSNRLSRSTFFNAYKRSVKNLVGKPFSKPIIISEKLDPKLTVMFEDVDRAGTHLDVFAVDLMEQGIKDGMVCVFVDYPDTSAVTDAAQEMANNPRPYLLKINVRNVIGCRYTVENGQYRLKQVRISECATEDDGDWGEKVIDQVRVLEPGTWRIYRQKRDLAGVTLSEEDGKQWVIFKEGVSSIKDAIPLVAYYTNRTAFMQAEPPLIDLAYLNVEHWQSSSDQRNILHVARVPILFGKAWQSIDAEGNMTVTVISSSSMITQPDANADLKYVEHSGKAIGSGKEDIEAIENRMAVMGTQVLVKRAPDATNKTATQTVADQEADYCDLTVMTRLLEDSLENAITFMAKYANLTVPDERFITINKDFGISAGAGVDAQLLLQARQAGEISQETFLNELKRRGILNPAVDVNDEMESIKLEPPKPGFGPPPEIPPTVTGE